MSDLPGDVFSPPTISTAPRAILFGGGESVNRIPAGHWSRMIDLRHSGVVTVFVANSTIKTLRAHGLEPDVLVFTDYNWFKDNERLVRDFQGEVVTFSRRAKVEMPELRRVRTVGGARLAPGVPMIRDGRSTGHRMMSLAIAAGARQIILLGYDMRIDPHTGRSHCHDDYQHTESGKSLAQEFVPSFFGWYRDCVAIGVSVINCTEGSALNEFPRMALGGLDLFRCEADA